MCRGKKKKKISSCFNNIIPTLTLPLTLRCLFSFSDVEHSRSGQWSYLPLPAPAVFSGRKAQYLRREFFFSPLRPEHFYQVKSWISSFATRIFYHQNISDFTTRITFFSPDPGTSISPVRRYITQCSSCVRTLGLNYSVGLPGYWLGKCDRI